MIAYIANLVRPHLVILMAYQITDFIYTNDFILRFVFLLNNRSKWFLTNYLPISFGVILLVMKQAFYRPSACDVTKKCFKYWYASNHNTLTTKHGSCAYVKGYMYIVSTILILYLNIVCNGGVVLLMWPPWPESLVYVPTMRVEAGQCNLTIISFRLVLSTHSCSLVVF